MIDYNEKIAGLRAEKGQLLQQAEDLVQQGKYEEVDGLSAQMDTLNSQIKSLEALAEASRQNAEPVYDGVLHSPGAAAGEQEDRPFANLGEQLNHRGRWRFCPADGFCRRHFGKRSAAEPAAQPAGSLHLLQRGQRHALAVCR